MKICGSHNVRKHIDIKNSDKYITLDILWKFGSLDKTKITYLDPKYYLGRSGNGLIASLDIKTNVSPKRKKGKVCHY